MSNKPNNHQAKPSKPPISFPEEYVPTSGIHSDQFSVPKTIVLPSAQVPAEPPKPAQAPPKPAQSGATEKAGQA